MHQHRAVLNKIPLFLRIKKFFMKNENSNLDIVQLKYRQDIDGLRAIAVISVVIFHAFPEFMKGGFIGVDVFFVISGFLITTIIFESLDKETFSFIDFYSRRIKRIFPALLLVLATCLISGWFLLIPDEINQLGKHIASGSVFVSNFVLWREAGYFDNSAESKPLIHLWSLAIEEQFYILWPLLMWFAWRKKLNLLTITILIAFISFYLNSKGIKKDATATFYSPQTRVWEILSGSILAWIILYKKNSFSKIKLIIDKYLTKVLYNNTVKAEGKTLLNLISCIGSIILIYGFLKINKNLEFPGKWAIFPVLGTALIIAAGPKAWINKHILSNKIVVWIGLISFPLYLWHWPLLSFIRIIDGETSSNYKRIAAIILAILLSWLTFNLIEKPFRFGKSKNRQKIFLLCGAILTLGCTGFLISKKDFSETHGYENRLIKRKSFEHAFGTSLDWYRGKDNWLFLGNNHDRTVEKLRLSRLPADMELKEVVNSFTKISNAASKNNVEIALVMAPNKSSIYSEYLPDAINPSPVKYSSFFLNELKKIPGLTVYDPTEDLINAKETNGILYWSTDTHWNKKGAFLVYKGFSEVIGTEIPSVDFIQTPPFMGDLIGIADLKNESLNQFDNWNVSWKEKPYWVEQLIPNEEKTTFGSSSIVTNSKPLSKKRVWVIGDSFTASLKPYLNATFKEVRYIGHWEHKLDKLPEELEKADRKPDLIVIVRVERSF